ncbi:phospholipase D-like domain-containing protein [Steroidobacter sp.]|uniref:phospholipase D-like domain-containing protein n=1 Tax=Steroidobacter sp. TaxID=1978227 RepID=UPI001A4E38E6|nr:phospholipase D-like domain-containing protein [Steroidobacter sp.]MBL8268111.1 PLDc N-terminal domain-containing protein [Steroidobacter sp.]
MIVDWLPTPSQHFLVSAIALLVYILTSRARDQRRAPTSAIAWVLGLALVPYLMLPLYLLFGQRKLKPVATPYVGVVVEGPHWAAELIESFGLAPPSACKVRMHADGEHAREALFEIIDGARHTLDISTFIIGNDAFGRDIVARLARRAKEGVQVRLLLDGFFSILAPGRFMRELREAGAQVAVFRPFFSLHRLGPRNLRNHRKLVVADDSHLWCGGRNLAAEYFLGDDSGTLWPDLSFDLEGPVAAAAGRQFDLDWNTTPLRTPLRERQQTSVKDGELAQFLPSGPDQVEDTAQSLLIDGCYRARRRFMIVTPYFVPDDSLRAAMRLAARRGVKVTIAIPRRSNHRLADFVRSRPMRDLAAAGVEFRLLPQMVHAKAVVIDETLAMCGSINLDLRSLLLNHEAAVVFYGRDTIEWLASWIAAMAEQGSAYRAEPPGLLRDIAEGVLLTVAFQL